MLIKDGFAFSHWCPACCDVHQFWSGDPSKPSWTCNEDLNFPTVHPSVKHSTKNHVCHYFIRNGYIEFCSDSSHRFASQTVRMFSMPSDYITYVTAVAIKTSDDVYSFKAPYRHSNLLSIGVWDLTARKAWDEGYAEGFLDTRGNFLDPVAALKVAVAAGQLNLAQGQTHLRSEDLW